MMIHSVHAYLCTVPYSHSVNIEEIPPFAQTNKSQRLTSSDVPSVTNKNPSSQLEVHIYQWMSINIESKGNHTVSRGAGRNHPRYRTTVVKPRGDRVIGWRLPVAADECS